jgi:hypothetical protein
MMTMMMINMVMMAKMTAMMMMHTIVTHAMLKNLEMLTRMVWIERVAMVTLTWVTLTRMMMVAEMTTLEL